MNALSKLTLVAILTMAGLGCASSDQPAPPTPAPPEPPLAATYPTCEAASSCEPDVHDSQGNRGDLREVQRYRLIGASSDGHRLAIMYAHFGPSSFVSFVNLMIYEVDATAFTYRLSLSGDPVGGPGSEEELADLEAQVLADSAQALADAGIEPGVHLPQPIAWCRDEGAIATDHCDLPQLTWSTPARACANGSADPAALWQLCTGEADGIQACAAETAEPTWDCLEGDVELLDLYWYGDVVWGIGERAIVPLPGLEFRILSAGGAIVAAAGA